MHLFYIKDGGRKFAQHSFHDLVQLPCGVFRGTKYQVLKFQVPSFSIKYELGLTLRYTEGYIVIFLTLRSQDLSLCGAIKPPW